MSSEGTCDNEAAGHVALWLADGGFISLLLAILVSFWGLGVVVEEYFVPALNLLCDDIHLADDVAGATIMAIGNSSPELFSCLVSLFVTKTSLGVGTAIGSAIFNHLCISAGSIFYAKEYTLHLDWRILSRECTFYLVSIILLVWVLKGGQFLPAFATAFDNVGGSTADCLFVHWYQALVLFLGYVAYVIVCSNYDAISSVLFPLDEGESGPKDDIETEISQSVGPGEHREVPRSLYVIDMDIPHLQISDSVIPQELIEIPHRRTMSFFGVVPSSVAGSSAAQARSRAQSSENNETVKYEGIRAGESRPLEPINISRNSSDSKVSLEEVNTGAPGVVNVRKRASASNIADRHGSGLAGNEVLAFRRNTTTNLRLYVPGGSAFGDEESRSGRSQFSSSNFPRTKETPQDKTEVHNEHLHADSEEGSTIGTGRQTSAVELHRMENMEVQRRGDLRSEGFQLWMYKRAKLFSRHRVLSNQKWELRYFTLDLNGLRYATTDELGAQKKYFVNLFGATGVRVSSAEHLEIEITLGKSAYRLRCLNEGELLVVFSSLQAEVNHFNTLSNADRKKLEAKAKARLRSTGQSSPHGGTSHNLLSTPDTSTARTIHYLLYPIKFLIYHTIPEIDRTEDRGEGSKQYWTTIMSSVLWLAILSYLMNFCLEEMGLILGISPGAMGLTFGAAGTSIPNLLSSMIVARQGLGNMAVSNAFGSNIFCIYFVLGFSWTLFTAVQGKPYDGLKDSGIVLLILILLAVLLVYLIVAAVSKFILRQWVAWVCLVTYAGFLAFSFALN